MCVYGDLCINLYRLDQCTKMFNTLLLYGSNYTIDEIFSSCFIPQVPRRFTFVGNSAVAEGQSIHSFSLRGCIVANFVPKETARFLLIQSDGAVGYDDASILENTSTGPSNLFFYGASTKCYKKVGNITYLLPNCSHDLLSDT